jgi:hypothetical protein
LFKLEYRDGFTCYLHYINRLSWPDPIVYTLLSHLAPVIGRIVNDPDRNYANYRGPDDCKTEADYERTKALLGQFADKPADHKDAVKNYIFETTDQCSCTRAIAGEEFDILMFSLGSSVSEANCL